MSEHDDRWTTIAREADLSEEEMATLRRAFVDLSRPEEIRPAAAIRVAHRLWGEARRPAAGSVARRLADLVSLGRAQVTLFSLPFWVVSIAVMVAGAGAAAVGLDPGRVLAFYLAAPLLAWVATAAAFRGQGSGPQELELSSPISPRELLLVRLFVILAYDLAIGFAASIPFALSGSSTLGSITLSWLGPLILATGATLVIASWIRAERAGAIVYAAWVVVVLGSTRVVNVSVAVLPSLEAVMVALGVLLIAVVVIALPGRFTIAAGRRTA
jgi:hypothetical protein